MKTFLDFLRRFNYLFLFVLLEAIGFYFLFRFNNYQGSVWYTAANDCTAKMNQIYADAASFFHLQENNARLTKDNALLAMRVEQLKCQLYDLKYDTTLIEQSLQQKENLYHLTEAKVVSNNITSSNNYIVINKGKLQGIRPEMGVVGYGGVVGIVYLTDNNHSLVIPIINSNSSISCKIRGTGAFGYLQWRGGNTLEAKLVDLPRYAKIKKGDVVETSGYSAVFPPGLFVGRVTNIKNSEDGQSLNLKVHLGTDFATLRNVCVIKTAYKPEIDSLMKKAKERDLNNAKIGF